MCNESDDRLTKEQKLEILKVELGLLQSRFDKYDDLFFRNRQLAVTISVAGVGAAITAGKPSILIVVALSSLALFFLELFNRLVFFRKIVQRHEIVRAALNEKFPLSQVVVYDPFNDLNQKPPKRQNIASLFYVEMILFYSSITIFPILVAKLM